METRNLVITESAAHLHAEYTLVDTRLLKLANTRFTHMQTSIYAMDILSIFMIKQMQMLILLLRAKIFSLYRIGYHIFLSHFGQKLGVLEVQFLQHVFYTKQKIWQNTVCRVLMRRPNEYSTELNGPVS